MRLPSEIEWEYACRAGTTTAFNTGDTIRADQANFDARDGKGGGVFRGKTTPVDTFKPNAWGLHDMHGNLRQWCSDGNDNIRVMRGGCWNESAECGRSAARCSVPPIYHNYFFGFRVVAEAP